MQQSGVQGTQRGVRAIAHRRRPGRRATRRTGQRPRHESEPCERGRTGQQQDASAPRRAAIAPEPGHERGGREPRGTRRERARDRQHGARPERRHQRGRIRRPCVQPPEVTERQAREPRILGWQSLQHRAHDPEMERPVAPQAEHRVRGMREQDRESDEYGTQPAGALPERGRSALPRTQGLGGRQQRDHRDEHARGAARLRQHHAQQGRDHGTRERGEQQRQGDACVMRRLGQHPAREPRARRDRQHDDDREPCQRGRPYGRGREHEGCGEQRHDEPAGPCASVAAQSVPRVMCRHIRSIGAPP